MSKAKKLQRDCPVLGRSMSPADCGSERGSRHQCPSDCPFFPFTPANYDQHLEIESRLIQKMHEGFARTAKDADKGPTMSAFVSGGDGFNASLGAHANLVWLYHGKRDASGLTFGERWVADRNSGLKNDERVLLQAVNGVRPALLEIQRVEDTQMVECVDLLTGAKLRVVDRALARGAQRYSVSLTWAYSMPHYDRLSGLAIVWPELPHLEPEEVLREIIAHLGGPPLVAEQSVWLAENFSKVCAAITAVQNSRWTLAMEALDARVFKTKYEADNTTALVAAFRKEEFLYPEEPSPEEFSRGITDVFVCSSRGANQGAGNPSREPRLALSEDDTSKFRNLVRGRVLVAGDAVTLEVFFAKENARMRETLEKLMGSSARFLSEHVQDLKPKSSPKTYDAGLVPQSLLENVVQISIESALIDSGSRVQSEDLKNYYEGLYQTFKDVPLPALAGATPLAAAANPELRPILVKVMKTHICSCDGVRRTKGVDLNLNPLLEELGLHELISEPPPLGMVQEEREDSVPDFDADSSDFFQSLLDKKVSRGPRLFQAPLSKPELEERIKAMNKRCADFEEAVEAVNLTFPDLLDFAWDINEGVLTENEGLFLWTLIVRACQILRPEEKGPCHLNLDGMALQMSKEVGRLSDGTKGGSKKQSDVMADWITSSAQPALLENLGENLLRGAEKVPSELRPRPEAILVILAFLKALLEELS